MSVKIKAEKNVNKNGTVGWIIKKLDGVIQEEKLPREYKGIDVPYFSGNNDKIYFRNESSFKNTSAKGEPSSIYVGAFIADSDFKRSLECMLEAGLRLHEINKRIKKLREEWTGTETFWI